MHTPVTITFTLPVPMTVPVPVYLAMRVVVNVTAHGTRCDFDDAYTDDCSNESDYDSTHDYN